MARGHPAGALFPRLLACQALSVVYSLVAGLLGHAGATAQILRRAFGDCVAPSRLIARSVAWEPLDWRLRPKAKSPVPVRMDTCAGVVLAMGGRRRSGRGKGNDQSALLETDGIIPQTTAHRGHLVQPGI